RPPAEFGAGRDGARASSWRVGRCGAPTTQPVTERPTTTRTTPMRRACHMRAVARRIVEIGVRESGGHHLPFVRPMTTLLDELRALPEALRAELEKHHFDAHTLVELSKKLGSSAASDNTVKGALAPPGPNDIVDLPEKESDLGKKYGARGLE